MKERSAKKHSQREGEREKKEINERKNADDRLEVIKRRSSVIKRMNFKKEGGGGEGALVLEGGGDLCTHQVHSFTWPRFF